jgi:hypothetical protein
VLFDDRRRVLVGAPEEPGGGADAPELLKSSDTDAE